MNELNGRARLAMTQIGVPDDLATLVRIDATPALSENAPQRASISVGHPTERGRAETAIANVPSADEALAYVGDRRKIASLIALGVKAMPAAARPVIPAWIAEAGDATLSDLRRARRLATDAAMTQEGVERSTGCGAGAPFADR